MKDIEGYEGKYAITKDAKIWSYAKINGKRMGKAKWLISQKDTSDYHFVALYKEKMKKQPKVHVLVALAFVYNPDPINLTQVNHKDGNKDNNNADNLKWVTCGQNHTHAFYIGLRNQDGTKNPSAKLSETQVLEIRKLYNEGTPQRQIAFLFNVHPVTIHNIVKRQTWTHI